MVQLRTIQFLLFIYPNRMALIHTNCLEEPTVHVMFLTPGHCLRECTQAKTLQRSMLNLSSMEDLFHADAQAQLSNSCFLTQTAWEAGINSRDCINQRCFFNCSPLTAISHPQRCLRVPFLSSQCHTNKVSNTLCVRFAAVVYVRCLNYLHAQVDELSLLTLDYGGNLNI